jgi:predicted DCC family thiol-disulfide oxidoreductase YuxK
MLVFIDAHCGLCQRFALWAERRLDRKTQPEPSVSWAAWGGTTHRNLIATRPKQWPPLPESPSGPSQDDHLEIFAEGRWFEGAAAVVFLLSFLRAPWSWVGKILSTLPQPVLVIAYGCIARARRKLSTVCQPSPSEFRQTIQP